MIRIREIVREGEMSVSNRLLPLEFPSKAEALAHIATLQIHFVHRGEDKKDAYWWARSEDGLKIYRWEIE